MDSDLIPDVNKPLRRSPMLQALMVAGLIAVGCAAIVVCGGLVVLDSSTLIAYAEYGGLGLSSTDGGWTYDDLVYVRESGVSPPVFVQFKGQKVGQLIDITEEDAMVWSTEVRCQEASDENPFRSAIYSHGSNQMVFQDGVLVRVQILWSEKAIMFSEAHDGTYHALPMSSSTMHKVFGKPIRIERHLRP